MKINNTILEIDKSWKELLKEDFNSQYFEDLITFLSSEYKTKSIFPPISQIFTAFNFTPVNKVKVVIIGQDPYHGKNQAHGLAFSVLTNIKLPPSLKNIFKEINNDLGITTPTTGVLTKWAEQGVLLINTVLTVEESKAGSHKNKGWETFTDSAIKKLSENKSGIIFMLWGKPAQTKEKIIDTKKHHILKSVHPSPLSAYRGFFGCQHFSKTNKILSKENKTIINWDISTIP